jgi:DNA mismatch endonuclease (patch repair protein)
MDIVTRKRRSEIMARIRGKDTQPELAVRRLLHGLGYRYRLHVREIPGRPDLVFTSRRKAVFVHGCFWHSHEGCARAFKPKSRKAFWEAKLAGNRLRDARQMESLRSRGWQGLVVWECELNDARLAKRLTRFLGRSPSKR